jgi:membrane peptidoglycan carboxypeptidase
VKPSKGKMLGGAPRTGRWTRQPEEARVGGRHRGSFIALLVIGAVLLGGIGTFGVLMYLHVHNGILEQRREARERPDWVPLARIPPHVRGAFALVVDTTSFKVAATQGRGDRPRLSRDLVRQVYLLDGGLRDEAREMAMAPLLEASTSANGLLELYLNRVYLGEAGEQPLHGVGQAAEEYFGKEPGALTISEAATLAAIVLPPRVRRPDAAPGAMGPRRNEVLRMMLRAGKITDETFQQALLEPLAFQPGVVHQPMARPRGWERQPEVIRLPDALQPTPPENEG